MTDDRLQSVRSSSRLRRALRGSLLLLFGFLLLSWVWLYFDSVHQRRKAESLIVDLKTFQFASAGFLDVRELAIRHGGRASAPLVQRMPACTAQDCTFEIWIKTGMTRFPLENKAEEFLYRVLPYLGIRSWMLYSMFVVSGGKLQESRTTIGEERWGRSGSYEGLIPFGYEVVSVPLSDSFDPRYDYAVGFPHVTGPPSNVLRARVVRTPDAPMLRAFDIDLSCLSSVFRDCRGFDELAPSAWADFLARKAEFDKGEIRK